MHSKPNTPFRSAFARARTFMRFGILLLLAIVIRSTPAQGADLDQARKEGEAVLYTTMVVSDFQIFQKALAKKYPFFRVNHVRLGGAAQASRAIAEHRAGTNLADVFGLSPDSMNYLRDQGILASYYSPEAKFHRQGFVDPKGYWSGITTDLLLTGVNTTQMSLDKAPRNYMDYLRPEYRGKMALHMGTDNPLIGMMEMLGEEKGLAYMRHLAKQSPILHNGYTKLTQLLAAGEFPLVAFTQVTKLEKMREKGAPIDWLATNPCFATVSSVAIAKKAPHPAAARLLVDFYLSEEGQKAIREMDKIPLRRGIDPDSKRISELLDKRLHVIKYEGDASRNIRLFNEIFLGR